MRVVGLHLCEAVGLGCGCLYFLVLWFGGLLVVWCGFDAEVWVLSCVGVGWCSGCWRGFGCSVCWWFSVWDFDGWLVYGLMLCA